ncbi:BTAD domain-containing putative transcriptional regulator [Actinomadura sp. DC4]|uniref:AfsR/SARP family transcriptional regulator n=1 Tax=Actinomadura sp. DC4 TaxID=3055069 RepID=UPI0025AF4A29|nr:BTAD domain-containing putative transcriptional regulator [Actinomadura sp. DC4]MDN3359697.1 BTAD domain-containing putative transcriptional regulator [Actinomadura sp. DC4]
MRIRLLGPIELRGDDGTRVAVSGPKRRAVLALLSLELGRAVPLGRFFELLWGDLPPAQARPALQGHVAALRKAFDGSSFTLLTRSPGYELTGSADAVDALRFDALTAQAARLDDAGAVAVLEEALGLWNGSALADLPDTELRAALADRLDGARTRAMRDWAERRLRLGQGPVAIPALEQNLRADGLNEPMAALLMRCLHQAGRTADAVAVHQHTQARLDEDLGVPPGPVLQEALAFVTARDREPVSGPAEKAAPASAAIPRVRGSGLPRPPAGFVGRIEESRWLDRECGPDRTGGGLAVVVGPAGAGKSATVIRWAHTATSGFADGHLFADLRGFDPAGPGDPAEALGSFLRTLGVPENAIPEDPGARCDLFREQTRERRLLVILDGARAAQDVMPLLPAGPGCATVITSRNRLEDLLVTDAAASLQLGALPSGDALGLLRRLLTEDRVAAEEEAAGRLVELCERLPLALRIAAARLVARPAWALADLVEELADERNRLPTLDTQGAMSVRGALSMTHRHLPLPAARLLALLAVHPGTEVDLSSAAALLDADLPRARQALGSLAAYHLLTESAPGRYARHDLIRLYGEELLSELGAGTRADALARLLDHHLAATHAAVRRVQPFYAASRPLAYEPRSLTPTPDVRSALAWFRAQEPVIRGLVALAAEGGEHERAWRLAWSANPLYYGAGQLTDRLRCLRAGLRAARLSGTARALAAMEAATASALSGSGRLTEALELVARALARTGPDDGDLYVYVLGVQALATGLSGDLTTAGRISETALDLIRTGGFQQHADSALSNAAALKGMAGEAEAALRYAREARELLSEHPAATFGLSAMVNEAQALHVLGRSREAGEVWREALELCRTVGSLQMHALAEHQYAQFNLELGRTDDAIQHLRAAIELYSSRGESALAERLGRQLSALEHG